MLIAAELDEPHMLLKSPSPAMQSIKSYYLFLSDVVLGKAYPGPLDNLVCNSKYKIEKFLFKRKKIKRR